jgi:L-alanine-DL-glutamate epimerase-like enolase superfamily enzyme
LLPRSEPTIDSVSARAVTIPTDAPESDGTLEWTSTTIIIVEVQGGGRTGVGYSYGSRAAASLVDELLAPAVRGHDAFDVPATYDAMLARVRNAGRPGIASTAISAVDLALWDLKAKLLDRPLVSVLGAARGSVPLYGSGGFTSYPIERLKDQLGGWASQGFKRVKMKVGRKPDRDPIRVRAAREAIGAGVELFVDANGAYTRKQALRMARAFAELDVRWFEEPVTSDDLEGLRLVRDRAPETMDVAAGEYGYVPVYFRRMLAAGAVDVLQADATRCGGVTGFLRVAALCDAWNLPLSAHTAPMAHLHVVCAAPRVIHLEWFHDHVRIESMLFDGFVEPVDGALGPDLSRPGLGIELKRSDVKALAA